MRILQYDDSIIDHVIVNLYTNITKTRWSDLSGFTVLQIKVPF